MRIAFFHELPKGGARIAVSEIAEKLKRKHFLDLYYSDTSMSREEHKNFENTYFFKFVPKSWKGKNAKARIYKDTVELYKLDRFHKKIAKIINSRKYDLVFVNASKFVESPFILRHLKSRTVFYLHDPHFRVVYEPIVQTKLKDPIRRQYEKFHLSLLKFIDKQNILKADYLIANSTYTKKTTWKSYGIDSEVAYLGVDEKFFKPASIVDKDIDVLYIGSRNVLDGYKTLQDAMPLLSKKIKVRTLFKEDEWLSHELVRELYRRSKIVLCLGVNEPFGLIAVEAMSCGTVPIAVDEGGYKESIVNGKTGYLIKRKPGELAQKINYLMLHPKQIDKLAVNARNHVLKYWTWEKSVSNIESLLSEIKKL